MSTRAALLAAVVAAPDDDTPRLVFADFEDEHGDPDRAAFIRLEIEAERHPTGSVERAELEREAALLYIQHADRWNAELTNVPLTRPDLIQVVYRRGFPAEYHSDYRHLFFYGRNHLRFGPIDTIRINKSNWPENRRGVMGLGTPESSPDLSNVDTLQIGPGCGALWRQYRPLPYQEDRDGGLVTCEPTIDYEPFGWDSTLLEVLTTYPTLTGLRRLVLSGNELPDEFLSPFVRRVPTAVFAATLTTLDMSDNQITDPGAAFLHSAAWVDQLAELDLSGNRFGDAGRMLLRQRFGDRVKL